MNGRKAKRFRREVYGENSRRDRQYQADGGKFWVSKVLRQLDKNGKRIVARVMGTLRCVGKRAEYQALKRSERRKG